MSLLAALTLFASLGHASATPTPSAPAATHAHLRGLALEISGTFDGDRPSLDPAFAASAIPSELTLSPRPGPAFLEGFTADGRRVIAFAFEPSPTFRLYLPIPPASLTQLYRLRLTNGSNVAERTSTAVGEPVIEVVGGENDAIVVAWNGRSYPELRVRETSTGPIIADVRSDGSTYEQVTVHSKARDLVVEVSDGVRSTSRLYHVFGR